MGRDSPGSHWPLIISSIPVLFYTILQVLGCYVGIGLVTMLCILVPPRWQPTLLLLLFLASLWFLGRSRPPNKPRRRRRKRPRSSCLRRKRWRRRCLPYHRAQRCHSRSASSIHRLCCLHNRWKRRNKNAQSRYRQRHKRLRENNSTETVQAPYDQLNTKSIEDVCNDRGK